MKIVICGSMSHSKGMLRLEEGLLLMGHEVVLPEHTREYALMDTLDKVVTESARNKINEDLIRGYYRKIEENDAILIANFTKNGIEGYIGGNAFLEMGFAYVLEKGIYLLNPLPDIHYRDEIVAMQSPVINGDLDLIN